MHAFRDSTATLLDRIHRLERENNRLRRRFRFDRFAIVRRVASGIADYVRLLLLISSVLLAMTVGIGILCAIFACAIGGIE